VEGFESRDSCRDGGVIGTMFAKERQCMKMTTVMAYSLLSCVIYDCCKKSDCAAACATVGAEYGL
jgi:hypothetical protein